MRGNELISALTAVFREHQSADHTVVIEVPGSRTYTQTIDTVEHRGSVTVIKTKRLVH